MKNVATLTKREIYKKPLMYLNMKTMRNGHKCY